jgi:hypothetical protein
MAVLPISGYVGAAHSAPSTQVVVMSADRTERHLRGQCVVLGLLWQGSVHDLEDAVTPLEPEVRIGDEERIHRLTPIDHPLSWQQQKVHSASM